ncbi:hypothetical protein BC629DRAFT_1497494 [Irpex lacteus]|nr:hypothetical protein BC629DRAFT_1497494 [Irpex lacteus]
MPENYHKIHLVFIFCYESHHESRQETVVSHGFAVASLQVSSYGGTGCSGHQNDIHFPRFAMQRKRPRYRPESFGSSNASFEVIILPFTGGTPNLWLVCFPYHHSASSTLHNTHLTISRKTHGGRAHQSRFSNLSFAKVQSFHTRLASNAPISENSSQVGGSASLALSRTLKGVMCEVAVG